MRCVQILRSAVMLSLAVSGIAAAAIPNGNVLAGVGSGRIKNFTPTGTLVSTLDSGTASNETTGLCFDSAGNIYATMFSAGKVSKFDPNGTLINGNFIIGLPSPESCQFNQAGELFVGLAAASQIRKYNSAGALLTTYATSTTTGWIDIQADQCTILYADDSVAVGKYNVCTSTQLPNFASVSNLASGLRSLANGDVLVSNRNSVVRFNSSGVLQATYPAPAGNSLIFAVARDPDGTTFWTADLINGNIFRYNIATVGAPITTFNSGQFVDTAGITIIGELTVGGPGGGGGGPAVNVPIPTLNSWAFIILASLLALIGIFAVRRVQASR